MGGPIAIMAFLVASCAATAALAQADDIPAADAAQAQAQDFNPDEMASYLNSQQRIKQSVTLTRTINGEVIEVDRRTITFSPSDPLRPTEAAPDAIDRVIEAFAREALTRTAAFEEARLDFSAADEDRDGFLSVAEFIKLVENWRAAERDWAENNEETGRAQYYRAFVEELDPERAQLELEQQAREKFASMAGAADRISREEYIREYLLDFDSMDKTGAMILRGEELMRFRALTRGEPINW
jgi:hypothetical protein